MALTYEIQFGQLSRNGLFLVNKFPSSKVVLDSRMGHSSRFVNLKTFLPIDHGLMGKKRCTA
jgi:hypothetical protein